MEKLNRALKCSILEPQNLGSRGPPWIRTCKNKLLSVIFVQMHPWVTNDKGGLLFFWWPLKLMYTSLLPPRTYFPNMINNNTSLMKLKMLTFERFLNNIEVNEFRELWNEMVSFGDTVSTYFNCHGGVGVGWGCVFWVSSDLNSGKKVRVVHLGGGGGFWVSSDLNSGKKVRVFHFFGGWGVLGKAGLEPWDNFNFGGGQSSGTEFQNGGGVIWRIWSKFLEA